MTDLSDLREFLEPSTLKLPIGGRVYTIPQVSAEVWLRLQAVYNDPKSAGDLDDIGLYRLALGDVFDTLLKEVTGPELQKAGVTAWLWQLGQEDLAVGFWQSGGKASPATTPDPSTSTSTGGATSTPSRASSRATTSRPKSKPRSTPARSSRGAQSSPTGN